MKRIWQGLSFVGVCLIANVAFATPPTIQHIPVNGTSTDSRCGFAVTVQQSGMIIDISYTDYQGVIHDFQAGPMMKQVMTNVATGKTITVNISGPGTYTYNPDGSFELVGTGNWSWADDPDNTSVAGWFLTSGRFVYSIDANGVVTFTRMGNKVNLCNELAP